MSREEADDDVFRKLIAQSVDGIIVVDFEGFVRLANESAARILRRPRESLLGFQFGCPSVSDGSVEISIAAETADPSVAEMRATEIEWHGERALLINLRDVTDSRRQRRRVEQLNRTLRCLLEISELTRSNIDREELIESVCEILVGRGNYRAAAILLVDGDGERCFSEASDGRSELSLRSALESPVQPLCAPSDEPSTDVSRFCPPADPCGECSWVDRCSNESRMAFKITGPSVDYGVLALATPLGAAADPAEIELAERLAAHLGDTLRARQVAAEHSLAVQQLRDSEARFRALFDSNIDAIVVSDDEGRCVHCNPAACRLFGYPQEELLRMKVGDLEASSGRPAGETGGELVRFGEGSGTAWFIRPDGSERAVEYSAFQLGPNRFASILRDVTKRHRLEGQLREAQKMEAVGQLAGGIAHDFNNLLTGIITFGGMVRDATPAGDARREDIIEVLRAADRATSLTRQLLAFSRRQPIVPRNLDLRDLVSNVERLLQRTLGENIELSTHLDEDTCPVFVDAAQFEQVLLNLAINARDAMPIGGTLRIEVKRSAGEGGGCGDSEGPILLRVSDNGLGMTKEVRRQVFEPFFTTKEHGRGTGLGLSMVYGLVQQAGGKIEIESAPGEGTSVVIRLPRSTTPVTTPTPVRDESRSLAGRETILIVDDQDIVRRASARILKMNGYSVLEACDGVEALDLYAREGHTIDLILCDVIMPKMGGPETVARLRALDPEIKVIFLSGFPGELKGIAEGEYLAKPFSPPDLLARIRKALEKKPPASS